MNVGYPCLERELAPVIELLMRRVSALAVRCASYGARPSPSASSGDSGDSSSSPTSTAGARNIVGDGTDAVRATGARVLRAAATASAAIARLSGLGYGSAAADEDHHHKYR